MAGRSSGDWRDVNTTIDVSGAGSGQAQVRDLSVSVETLDDVSFESNGDALAVLQTKRPVHGTSGLSDLSPDLYKTIRIWMVGRSSGEVAVELAWPGPQPPMQALDMSERLIAAPWMTPRWENTVSRTNSFACAKAGRA